MTVISFPTAQNTSLENGYAPDDNDLSSSVVPQYVISEYDSASLEDLTVRFDSLLEVCSLFDAPKFLSLGETYHQLGSQDSAEICFQKALQLSAGIGDTQTQLRAMELLIDVASSTEDFELALLRKTAKDELESLFSEVKAIPFAKQLMNEHPADSNSLNPESQKAALSILKHHFSELLGGDSSNSLMLERGARAALKIFVVGVEQAGWIDDTFIAVSARELASKIDCGVATDSIKEFLYKALPELSEVFSLGISDKSLVQYS